MNEELKPCPFCGGEAEVIKLENYHTQSYRYFVTCRVCGAEIPRISRSRQQAKSVWNRRADNETKTS